MQPFNSLKNIKISYDHDFKGILGMLWSYVHPLNTPKYGHSGWSRQTEYTPGLLLFIVNIHVCSRLRAECKQNLNVVWTHRARSSSGTARQRHEKDADEQRSPAGGGWKHWKVNLQIFSRESSKQQLPLFDFNSLLAQKDGLVFYDGW